MATSSVQTNPTSNMFCTESELDHVVLDVPSYNVKFNGRMLIAHVLSEMTEMDKYGAPLFNKVEKVNNTTGDIETLYDLTTEEGYEHRRKCIRNGRRDITLLADMISLSEYSTILFYVWDSYVVTYSERWSRGSNTWATRLYFSDACNLR
ncbi:MAG: hypothetical protein QF535_14790, partial [Anaerolineales bacterium]|nr:hypothetical protein [Anaerolineales bacterium]